jgi:4-hydroxybenzoate polyprenyltransferase
MMSFRSHLILLRPHQWLKNLMLYFPPFLSGALFIPGMFVKGLLPFIAFSLVSSAAYIFNDLQDAECDRRHPVKHARPIASGAVRTSAAVCMIFLLLFGAFALGSLVLWRFLSFLAIYLLVTALYSLSLKALPVIDIFCIALGFVLRLYAGGEAFGVLISDWLFLTVFLLALFLSVGKRYSERVSLGCDAGKHRRALQNYPEGFLESAMYLSGSAVLVTYSIYVVNRPLMVYTVPLCMFGLLRYLFCVKSGQSGDPTHALLRDRPLLATGILWVAMVAWGIYQ